MRKHYSTSFFVFVFCLFFSFSALAQVVANNDQGSVAFSNGIQIGIQNILGNDTLNGIPVTLSDVTISQVSATSSNVYVEPNGTAVVNANTPLGSYIVTYQICTTTSTPVCDFAEVHINVTTPPVTNSPLPDNVTISNNVSPNQIIIEDIVANDIFTLNNIPITPSTVTFYQESATAGYFSMDSNHNIVTVNSPIPIGNYTLHYQTCIHLQTIPPINNCHDGTITIHVVNSLLTQVTGAYQDLNGDGFTNVGDVINYTFAINNIGTQPVTEISITSGEANINGGPPIPLLNPGASDLSTYTGVHVLTQEEINNNQAIIAIQTLGTSNGNPISVSSTNVVHLNISDGIKLNLFIDINGNGIQDVGESNYTGNGIGNFNYEINNDGTIHNITSTTGSYYLYESNSSTSYDLSFVLNPTLAPYYNVTTSSYSNVTVADGSGITTYNFPLTIIPYNDLAIHIFSYGGPPRPGFLYFNDVYISNSGYQTVASATLTLTGSTLANIISYPSGATPTANGFTITLTNLQPGEIRYVSFIQSIPTIPTVNLGDLITNSASITVPAADINPANNVTGYTQTVVGSYDPNEKTESHGGQIVNSTFSSNDYLTYTIRFENTGTAEAINIRVNDVLDSQLDETTVRMVTASHPFVLDRVGSNLTWRFDGINLPPSVPNDPITGHGYLVFQVKPKPGYTIGDVIPNTAAIYFDFNPAIVTNTCTTTFVNQLGHPDFAFGNLRYYPNPVKDQLFISNDSPIDNITITSLLGQTVMAKTIHGLQANLSVSELSIGVYFVKVTSGGQSKTLTIIKE